MRKKKQDFYLMTNEELKQSIMEAVNAIDDEWLLCQIARLIYNITNPKQNGNHEYNKAAEILQNKI